MSVERSFEAWEEVQRHGLDLADRFTQSFNGLIQSHITPPSFTTKLEFSARNLVKHDFGLAAIHTNSSVGINDGVSTIFDIGNKLGQAGAEFGSGLSGMVQQFFRRLPLPFRHEEVSMTLSRGRSSDVVVGISGLQVQEDLELLVKRFDCGGVMADEKIVNGSTGEEESSGFNLKNAGYHGQSQGTFNITTTYDSRTQGAESSLVARGDLWRVEASHGSSPSGNERSSLFLVQLGPVLFVRDSTLLLPVHLSKQHLLWYGYDRKNGMHSLCPAVWSKHRRWLLMSMICLNPLACSFMDLQFPNGQFTYVSGEGLSTSVFLPLFGGLLQAQGQCPGEMRFSFACKNKLGTRVTPTVQWPDKSFTMGFEQVLAWRRSGLMMRPTVQFRLCPTIGGSNPGLRAEIAHSVKEELSLSCGCTLLRHPSAFASVSVGSSKWNRNVGVVVRVETPFGNVGQPSVSVKLNSGIEF